jgi:hypothetical protein
MIHRPKTHHYVILALEFINWGMFLAVWIALSVNIGKHQECAATLDSGHSHSRPCNTAYTAIAFAIVDWILFTVTFVMVGLAISNGDTQTFNEKNTGAAGVPIRASDDGTLRGEANA